MTPRLSRLARSWNEGEPNALTRALAARRAAGGEVLDLTDGNPNAQGIAFPPDRLEAIMREALGRLGPAQPGPLGDARARAAVAAWYGRRGFAVHADHIALTPGTSQAYFYCFRLLAEPGEAVLAPTPGYPLFDELAVIAGVELRRYPLARDAAGGWRYDPDLIDAACTGDERALIVVAPHNPTGAMPDAAAWSAMGEVCRRRDLALVVDEVFCETLPTGAPRMVRPRAADFPLALTLNGVSKMLALPQWKLGWIAADGDAANVARWTAALEFMNDAFLPMPSLGQAMLPGLLAAGEAGEGSEAGVLADLAGAIDARRWRALELLRRPVEPCPAGVYLCLPLDDGADDESAALEALTRAGVLLHPGYYYDLPSHLVMTCLAPPEVMETAIARLNGLG
jgi:aspartate/methionine/tyrosine aminotransferase